MSTEKKTAEKEKKSSAEPEKKEPSQTPEKKTQSETTTTYNDTNIADLAKLTALNSRGDHMQFSMGDKTDICYGETSDVVNGKLTLDNGILGVPQFRITLDRSPLEGKKWHLTSINLKNHTYINKKEITDSEPVELHDGDLIRIMEGNKSQVFVFEDSYNPNVEWKSHLLRNKK